MKHSQISKLGHFNVNVKCAIGRIVVSHCILVARVIGTVLLSGEGIVIGVHTSDRSGNHHAAVYIAILQYNAHSGEKPNKLQFSNTIPALKF